MLGVFCIFFKFVSHFWHTTMTQLLFYMSYICNNSILYLYVSHFEVFGANLDLYDILCHFLTFTQLLAKNSKLRMLSAHIIKITILSYNSTHQIALNKRCPQSSQYRNWPAYYKALWYVLVNKYNGVIRNSSTLYQFYGWVLLEGYSMAYHVIE